MGTAVTSSPGSEALNPQSGGLCDGSGRPEGGAPAAGSVPQEAEVWQEEGTVGPPAEAFTSKTSCPGVSGKRRGFWNMLEGDGSSV